MNPANILTNGDWMLFSIQNYVNKKVRPHGVRHGKTEAQKEHFIVHNARRRCMKKKLEEFTIASNEFQHIVIRNSKLAGLRRKASRCFNLHRKTTLIAHLREIGKMGFHTGQMRKNAPMKLQTSEKHLKICAVSTVNLKKSDLKQFFSVNTENGIRCPLHPVPHGGSRMNTGGAHNLRVNHL